MPEIVKAFIARSFAQQDVQRLQPLLDFLKTFENFGFFCQSAEPAEAEQVSEKVQRIIRESNVFIGMFTRKYPIAGAALGQSESHSEPKRWTVPSWVLQESGYALGLGGKKLLFFVETDVELPKLAGDLEYIEYDSARPDLAFKRANEALGKIISQSLALEVVPVIRQETQTPPPEPTVEEQKKPDEAGLLTNLRTIWSSLDKDDQSAAQKAYEEGLEYVKREKPETELSWKILYQQERVDRGYPEGLDELHILESQHPDAAIASGAIGHCLRYFKNFRVAAEAYERATSKAPVEKRAFYIISRAECLQDAKDVLAARRVLLEALHEVPIKSKLEVLSKLYENFKLSNCKYDAFAIAEHSLQENGAQTDLRFRLAYDYAEEDLSDLAAYHYKVVIEQRGTDSTAMNNLAIALWSLGLPMEAVQLYKKASAAGNTLAAGNLAVRYLDAGMAEEARAVIDVALKTTEPNPMVTDALAAIARRKEEEKQKHDEALAEASRKREFFAQMGEAIIVEEKIDVSAKWKFPDIQIELRVDGKSVKGTASKPIYPTGFWTLLDRDKPWKTEVHTFEGQLTGRVCEFNISVEQKDVSGYMSPYDANRHSKGYLIFAHDGKSGHVLEIEPKTKKYEISVA